MSIFKISIKLTDFGFDHYTDIIKLIYQYIAMLRQNGIPVSSAFASLIDRRTCTMKRTRFLASSLPMPTRTTTLSTPLPDCSFPSYIAGFASALQTIPYRYVLHSDHMYRHYSASSMMNYINHLTVDNMVMYASPRPLTL